MTDAMRVKALEWREVGELHFALSPLGIYETQDAGGSGWWIVVDGKSVCFDDGLPPIFQTLEEAKAACQADFARRVSECVVVDAGWREVIEACLRDFQMINASGLWKGHPFTHAVAMCEEALAQPLPPTTR